MLRGGSDVPGRYGVDYSSGITVILDAEGTLDAALKVKSVADDRLLDTRLRTRLRKILQHERVQRVRLLGPQEGGPPEVIDPDEDEREEGT